MWKSIVEMLQNIDCNYLVLRNYEEFENNELITEHTDIDLLCDDVAKIQKELKAVKKLAYDDIHCWVEISGQRVSVDIRTVGAGYYDTKWEETMLLQRKSYKDLFYVMDSENYFYSLIYHELCHKEELKDEYWIRLLHLAKELNILITRDNMEELLDSYMKKKNYKYTGYKSIK